MKCLFCKKGETRARKVTYLHHNLQGEIAAIFKNFPALVCIFCGEEYYKPQDLRRAERILQQKDEFEETVTLPIINF